MLKLKRNKVERIYLGAIVLWILGIVYACLAPNDDLPSMPTIPHLDKLAHFIFYFGLMHLLLGYRLLKSWQTYVSGFMIILVVALGISIEFLQRAMGFGRAFSVEDMLANLLGLLLGIILYCFLENTYEKIYNNIIK